MFLLEAFKKKVNTIPEKGLIPSRWKNVHQAPDNAPVTKKLHKMT